MDSSHAAHVRRNEHARASTSCRRRPFEPWEGSTTAQCSYKHSNLCTPQSTLTDVQQGICTQHSPFVHITHLRLGAYTHSRSNPSYPIRYSTTRAAQLFFTVSIVRLHNTATSKHNDDCACARSHTDTHAHSLMQDIGVAHHFHCGEYARHGCCTQLTATSSPEKWQTVDEISPLHRT